MDEKERSIFLEGIAVGENQQKLHARQLALEKRIQKLNDALAAVNVEIAEVEKYIRHKTEGI